MDISVNWKEGLAFDGKAQESGYSLQLDGEKEVGGKEQGFRPMELMALSVAGCTAMDVISILQKKRQKVRDFQVTVHTEKADEYPRVWTEVAIEYIVTGEDIDPAAVERAIELSAEKYCPAQNMVKQAVSIEHSYQIIAA